MAGSGEIGVVLERLDRAIADAAPKLRSTLCPPVEPRDLDRLRRAVDPFDVPADVEAVLRWSDGQQSWPPLPTLTTSGALLRAAASAEHYTWLRSNAEDWQWNALWLPIAREGRAQAGVEMTQHAGAVLDVDWGSADVSIIAPSLAVLLDAAADMIEAGLAIEPRYDDDHHGEWRDRCRLILEARGEWREWPYDRLIAQEMAGWPPHWRVAAGLSAEPDLPHPPAQPIGSVLSGTAGRTEPVTIEGYVTDRALIDGQASGNSIIALNDRTGTVRVLIPPDAEGAYWAAWLGRRIQIDVLAGADAMRRIDDVLDAEPDRRRRAPIGTYVLAVSVRLGVQRARSGPTRT